MLELGVAGLIALAQIAEPRIEPLAVVATCREAPDLYGKPKLAWRDVDGNQIDWCLPI